MNMNNEALKLSYSDVPASLQLQIREQKEKHQHQRFRLVQRITTSDERIFHKYYLKDKVDDPTPKEVKVPFEMENDSIVLLLKQERKQSLRTTSIRLAVNTKDPEKHSKMLFTIIQDGKETTLIDNEGTTIDDLDELEKCAEIMEFANKTDQSVQEKINTPPSLEG